MAKDKAEQDEVVRREFAERTARDNRQRELDRREAMRMAQAIATQPPLVSVVS